MIEAVSQGKRLERATDASGYVEAHEAFRRASDQAERIADWFERHRLLDLRAGVPAVLSVGTGGGEVDVHLIEALRRKGAFVYDALEPSGDALGRFRTRCEQFGGVPGGVWMNEGRFEEFESSLRYDLIHFVHAVYSMRNLEEALGKAFRMLREGGSLALVCCTDEGVNAFLRDVLREVSLPGRTGTMPEADLIAALSTLSGGEQRFELVPSEIAVGACFQPGGRAGHLLNFLLQADSSQLSARERAAVMDALHAHSVERDGNRWISQPMLAISVRKAAPATRRVRLGVGAGASVGDLAEVACLGA